MKRTNTEEFVAIWQSSATVEEAAQRAKIKRNCAKVRASRYRKMGVQLKRMPTISIAKQEKDFLVNEAKDMLAGLRDGKWEPWNWYREEWRSSGQDEISISIGVPPCVRCRYWRPVAHGFTRDGHRVFSGVRLCHAEEQFNDFSCFKHG